MSQIEYLIPLVSIIVGLGLADLIQSVRELVRPNRAVRWHWLPVLWSVTVFLLVLQIWWTSFGVLQEAAFGRVLVFLPYLLMFLALYLACAFALPDSDWTPGTTPESPAQKSGTSPASTSALDLEVFYFSASHRRWFFGTLIAIIVLFESITVFFLLVEMDATLLSILAGRWVALSVVPAVLALPIVTDRRWVHGALGLLAFGGAVFSLFQASPIGG
jgi:hypothetical protein